MDFFEHQDAARRATRKLIFLFALGMAGVVLAVYAAFALVLIPPSAYRGDAARYAMDSLMDPDSERHRALGLAEWLFDRPWWSPGLFFPVAGGTALLVLLGSGVRASQLSEGGRAVASMLGGRLLNANATEAAERRLLNVVEEMALAAGVPVPPVYLLAEEPGINAFAAGHTPGDAVIGVTRGCVGLLSRDELQGVIGHEFSHILNGDMRLNMRLMAVVFGITMIASVGEAAVRLGARTGSVGGRSSRGGGFPMVFFLLGALLYIVGWVGVFFGSLIRSAISREREFLADASSVQFTRNPGGIAGALKKIGGLAQGSRLGAVRAAEAGHFYFSNGLGAAWFGAFATHPPLEERILRLDPQFDGVFPKVGLPPGEPEPPRAPAIERARALGKLAHPSSPADFVANVGMLTADQMYYVEAIRRGMPEALIEASHEPVAACAVVFGLLLSGDGEVCARQLQRLQARLGQAQFEETTKLLPRVRELPPELRLPMGDVAVQGLRQLSPAQFGQFLDAIDELVSADEQVDLFEFALQRLLRGHLEPHFKSVARPEVRFRSWEPILPDALLALSALAHSGADGDRARAEEAFRKGAAQIETGRRVDWPMAAPEECCDLGRIDAALTRLREASPWLKKNFLFAAATTVMADREISVPEGELLRAIADSLDCPVPPFARGKWHATPFA